MKEKEILCVYMCSFKAVKWCLGSSDWKLILILNGEESECMDSVSSSSQRLVLALVLFTYITIKKSLIVKQHNSKTTHLCFK